MKTSFPASYGAVYDSFAIKNMHTVQNTRKSKTFEES